MVSFYGVRCALPCLCVSAVIVVLCDQTSFVIASWFACFQVEWLLCCNSGWHGFVLLLWLCLLFSSRRLVFPCAIIPVVCCRAWFVVSAMPLHVCVVIAFGGCWLSRLFSVLLCLSAPSVFLCNAFVCFPSVRRSCTVVLCRGFSGFWLSCCVVFSRCRFRVHVSLLLLLGLSCCLKTNGSLLFCHRSRSFLVLCAVIPVLCCRARFGVCVCSYVTTASVGTSRLFIGSNFLCSGCYVSFFVFVP